MIETTHTRHGMLEQGGVIGRRVAYSVEDVLRATGLSRQELEALPDVNAPCPGSDATVREMVEHHCSGRVLDHGHRIQ